MACHAAEQGLVDLLRFKGDPPPPDYVPFWEAQMNGDGDTYVPKRKEPERDLDGEGRDRMKRKRGSNGSDTDDILPSKPAPPKYTLPYAPNLPPNPVTVMHLILSLRETAGKGLVRLHPEVLGPINDFAPASRSVGQDRSGSRSGGISHTPQAYYPSGTSSPPPSRNPPPRMHSHAPYYDDQKDYRPGPGYQGAHGYDHADSYRHAYPVYPSPPPQVITIAAATALRRRRRLRHLCAPARLHLHRRHHQRNCLRTITLAYYGTPPAPSPPRSAFFICIFVPTALSIAIPTCGALPRHLLSSSSCNVFTRLHHPHNAMSHGHPVSDPYSYPPSGYHHPSYPPGSPPPRCLLLVIHIMSLTHLIQWMLGHTNRPTGTEQSATAQHCCRFS